MAYVIHPGDPRDPRALVLLQASHDLMTSMFSPDDCHQLSVEGLTEPGVTFLTAVEGEAVLGCGALARREGYAEVKSMFTAAEARGRGVAAAVLQALEALARAEGIAVLRLETGVGLDAAIRLYEGQGWVARGAFGAYPEGGASLFYEKRLG